MTDVSSQTLHVVSKELGATLNEARVALENFAEHPDSVGMLVQCAEHLHQAQAAPAQSGGVDVQMTVEHWARRLRARFQVGLLGWIRGERIKSNLEILSRVAEKLEQIANTQPVFQLWWVTGAVLEGLQDGGLQ